MTTTLSMRSSAEQKRSLDVFEVKPGVHFDVATLRDLLPDNETLLFFGKVYKLDAQQLGALLHKVRNTDLTTVLFAEGGKHSQDLQDYLLDGYTTHDEDCPGYYDDSLCICTPEWVPGIVHQTVTEGELDFDPDIPVGELLPDVLESLKVEVAASIQAVAAKLESTVGLLPGKQGSMIFRTMMTMNRNRPTIGDYRAGIHHDRQKQNLVILDDSGSMSLETIQAIVEDVVALAYNANAHFALVSSSCRYWEPGTYSVDTLLDAAEIWGTHYETLVPLLNRDWGTVITIADYDSSQAAKDQIRAECTGHIDELLDISLVSRPTFLAECVGQLAANCKPLLIASEDANLVTTW